MQFPSRAPAGEGPPEPDLTGVDVRRAATITRDAAASGSRPRSADTWWVLIGVSVSIALVIWLPFQTPVAAVLYQYARLDAGVVRALVLVKDALAGLAVLLLLAWGWRRLRWLWFDLAALGYVVLVALYALLPVLEGRGLPTMAVAASVRNFVLPVELYLLGRLASIAGLPLGRLVVVFLGVSAVAAAFTVLQYFLVPVTFWASTIDLVAYVRDIQLISSARDLASISVLGHFGVGDTASFPRAVGTFTHPVGTGHYFVVPLSLGVAGLLAGDTRPSGKRRLLVGSLVTLFAVSVIVPISRGAWIAAAVSVLLVGWLASRLRPVIVGLGLAVVFLMLVPPYSYSVTSALTAGDMSIRGHLGAIEHGIRVILSNPLGLGAGHADQPGVVYSVPPTPVPSSPPDAGSSAPEPGPQVTPEGVGENMYLSIWVTAGPVGLALFLAWVVGWTIQLLSVARADWMRLGILAALVGLLVASAFASPLMRFTSGGLPWLLLGVAVGSVPTAPRLGLRLRPADSRWKGVEPAP